MRGFSPAVASGGHSSSLCAGLSPSRPLPLRSTGSRRAVSATVAHGPSRSAARGILPDQGPNPRPLYWQADSQPLRHQGSPLSFLNKQFTGHKNFNSFYKNIPTFNNSLKAEILILRHSLSFTSCEGGFPLRQVNVTLSSGSLCCLFKDQAGREQIFKVSFCHLKLSITFL